ncbi:MAG: HEAT repeat domain-containing protein [Chlamydiia bacterium]|nr:HEAT repeat domain-containing protein [Chlamydiia bacterium]
MTTQIPILDAVDLEILMHRDAHFGGHFEVMIEYYDNDGVGVQSDFDIKRIRQLAHIEKETDGDLSDLVLPNAARVQVERSKQLYLDLREVHEKDDPNHHALIFSNLVLSEEEYPEQEIADIIAEGGEMVPLLIDLISSDSFYDPLFPGYGRTPIFAAHCLAELGDEMAIHALFNAMGQENFFTDEAMIKALKSFGDKSKQFLLKALNHKPISKNNEHAAIALMEFSDEPDVASACLQLLPDALSHPVLATYLIFGCSALSKSSDQQKFKKLAQTAQSDLAHEMNVIIKSWK